MCNNLIICDNIHNIFLYINKIWQQWFKFLQISSQLFFVLFIQYNFKNNYFIVYTIFIYNFLSAFFPNHLPLPQPNPPLPLASILPPGFVHVSLIVVPENPSPHYPSHLPSGYCQIVLNFYVSGYILLAFFFC